MRTVIGSLLATGEAGKVYEVLILRSQAGIELPQGASLRVERIEYLTTCGLPARREGAAVFVLVESGEILVPFDGEASDGAI